MSHTATASPAAPQARDIIIPDWERNVCDVRSIILLGKERRECIQEASGINLNIQNYEPGRSDREMASGAENPKLLIDVFAEKSFVTDGKFVSGLQEAFFVCVEE